MTREKSFMQTIDRLIVMGILAALASPATAAPTPRNGTVSEASPSLTFSGSLLVSDPSGLTCGAPGRNQNPAPSCDRFTLTVSGLSAEFAAGAQVRVSMAFEDEDYDLWVYDSAGNEKGSSFYSNPEVVTFAAAAGTNTYDIDVQGYIATGGTYTTTVSLVTGGGGGDPTCQIPAGDLP
jgi:hypothetical protein